MTAPTTIILRGIPGSGKSTWARRHHPDAVIVSADHLFVTDGRYVFDPRLIGRAHHASWRAFCRAVETGTPVIVVDNTNIHTWEMAPYVLHAEAYGRAVEIITIDCPLDVAAARQIHDVPAATIGRMLADLIDETPRMPRHWPHRTVRVG